MKKSLAAGFAFAALVAAPALAADLPVKAAVYKAAPYESYNWTGCYVGVVAGGAWGRSTQDAASGTFAGQTITGRFDVRGWTAGGTVGCNYQSGQWLIGLEDDFSWTDKRGRHFDIAPFNPAAFSETKEKWLDTFRVRLGWTVDRWLLAVTGGAAWAGSDVNVCNTTVNLCVGDSRKRFGWTIGAVGEYAFASSWSLKLEYLYVDLGSARYIDSPIPVPGAGTIVTRDVSLNDHILRIGLNYRFGAGPVIARY